MPTPSWIRKLTRLERITIVLVIAAVFNALLQSMSGYSLIGGDLIQVFAVVSVIVFTIVSIRRLFKLLLWRVRNRLLFTYFLVGVVPIVLILAMIGIGVPLLLGQMVGYLVSQEVGNRVSVIQAASHNVALAAASDPSSGAFIDDLRARVPDLRVLIRRPDGLTADPTDSELKAIPEWSTPGFEGLIELEEGYFVSAFARVSGQGRDIDVFGFVPLDANMLASIGADFAAVNILSVVGDDNRLNINVNAGLNNQVRSSDVTPLPPSKGVWDAPIGWGVLHPITRQDGSSAWVVMPITSRPSLVLAKIFSTLGEAAPFLVYAFLILGGVFLMVEIVSLVWSASLTRSITRSIHDLYEGTQRVDAGNFTHRIPIRTKDQLGALAGSFNSMTQHLQLLIAEVREKERLESELEIAREVQSQLFPRGVPKLKTLELAGICKPGRIVSGDYYDFVKLDSRWTALAIGDVSGKGISAALLMASIQSAVHAQWTMADAVRNASQVLSEAPSTATLVTRLNRQLFESTSPEKYATFYCAVFDDDSGRLLYTNAGHLPPILIRRGRATRLDVSGTVVGILADSAYEQQVIELQSGDLLVAFTDGITEAENAAGEQFGEDRLVEILIENAQLPLDSLIELIVDRVQHWAHDLENQDDTTMLLARRL